MNFNTSSKDIEAQWILIKNPQSKTIILGNIYRPPQENITSFIDYLENTLDIINLDKVELFLMGDFNIDDADSNNPDIKKLQEPMKQYGLRQIIKDFTRYSVNKKIDLCFTGVDDINLSDHQMILITRKKLNVAKKICTFEGRSYRNYSKHQNSIPDSNWDEYENVNEIDAKWDFLLNILKSAIENMCPLKTFKIKQEKELWITLQLIELIKDKEWTS